MISPLDEHRLQLTRRHFFNRCSLSIGTAALAALLKEDGWRCAAADVMQRPAACRICRISRRRRSV